MFPSGMTAPPATPAQYSARHARTESRLTASCQGCGEKFTRHSLKSDAVICLACLKLAQETSRRGFSGWLRALFRRR